MPLTFDQGLKLGEFGLNVCERAPAGMWQLIIFAFLIICCIAPDEVRRFIKACVDKAIQALEGT